MLRFKNLYSIITIVVIALVVINLPVFALHATIKELSGTGSDSKVAIKKTENSNFVKAQINDLIRENGIIVTGKGEDSQVELLIEDGSSSAIVRLGSQSYLKLASSSDKVKLLLDEGIVLVGNTGSLNLNVYVGNYVASSDGTTFTVDVIDAGDSNEQVDVDVEVLEGQVRFNKDGDDAQKAYYILPGEKAKFNLKFKKVPAESITRDKNIEKLEKVGLFEANRLAKLNKQINEFNSGSAQLQNTNFQKVKIEMKGPLFAKFKAELHQGNLEKVRQNQQFQKEGQLEIKNNQRRQNNLPQGHPQLNNSSMNNIEDKPIDKPKPDFIQTKTKDIKNNQNNSNMINQGSHDSNLQKNNNNTQTQNRNKSTIKQENKQPNTVNEQPKSNIKKNKSSSTVILSSPSSNSSNGNKTSQTTRYNKPKKHQKVKQTNVNNKQPGGTRPDINRNPSLNEGVNSMQPQPSLPTIVPKNPPPPKNIMPAIKK